MKNVDKLLKGILEEEMSAEIRTRLIELSLLIEEERGLVKNNNLNKSEHLDCPCCGSDKTYKTEAIHCNRCAVTTEI